MSRATSLKITLEKKPFTKTATVGVLGNGEIGKSLAKFFDNPLIRDLNTNGFHNELEVMHVCIPYSEKFAEIVIDNIKTYEPELVIIHSTVAVGTTKKISGFHKMTVHSPVRGVHPNLYEGMKTFVKFIGADSKEAGELAQKHFEEVGIKSEIMHDSKTTELGKLLSTTYYGLAIAYHSYTEKLCGEHGVDFENVMKRFNETYNEGYKELGKENVVRPTLHPPKDGKIGGHCVVPNAKILLKQFGDDPILKSILRHR